MARKRTRIQNFQTINNASQLRNMAICYFLQFQRNISVSKYSIIIIMMLSCLTQELLSVCPRLCECKWKSGKESVLCLNANLTSVPLELDGGTQVLDLTSNNLTNVKNDEFSAAGLLNLQRIYIAKCRLKSLERFAFRNLINLIELDLSYNFLPIVPSHVLEYIPELRELKLNGNPIQRIVNDAFSHVPQLVRLELSDCKIGTIEARVFAGLENSLEWLKLDGNRLIDVRSTTLTSLQNLHGLELANNPWNCSCSLRPLREWTLRQNVPFGVPPVCKYPPRLMSKPWDRLDLDEFACVPKILAPDPKAHGVEGRNITITCRIAGVPEPNVRWLLKNRVIANLTGVPYANGKKVYVVRVQNNSSNLTILTADVQDAGVYVCAAENKAGRVEASVTLAVSRKPPERTLSNKAILIGVIVTILCTLTTCLLVLCVCSARRRQHMIHWQNRRSANGRRQEDNYEKIEMNHKVIGGNGGNGLGPPNLGGCGGDVAIVGPIRRNGEYRGVPCLDTDEDEDVGYEDNTETPTPTTTNGNNRESKLWTAAAAARSTSSPNNGHWNSALCENIPDPDDLHIPRRTKEESRDDCNKKQNSTSGTFKPYTDFPSKPTNKSEDTSNKLFNVIGEFSQSLQPHVMRKEVLKDGTGNLYTSAPPVLNKNKLLEPQFPDIVDFSNMLLHSYEDGAINYNLLSNITKDRVNKNDNNLYCTIPRKKSVYSKTNIRYRSCDSESPLLPESRYCSSGGESSCGSQDSSKFRRLSEDSFNYPFSNAHVVNQRSNSYVNLISSQHNLYSQSKFPRGVSPPGSTPLLDVGDLHSHLQTNLITSSSNSNLLSNNYDYHAAQLERFLEEYRNLQKQLNKMKENCDNIRQKENDTKELNGSKFLEPQLHNNIVITPSSGSEDSNPKSILKKSPATTITPSSLSSMSSTVLDLSSPISSSGEIFRSDLFPN